MALFRYPGGKAKASRAIVGRLSAFLLRHPDHEYREPFLGAGAVAFDLLEGNDDLKHIWLNDRDPSISAVWNSVIYKTGELMDRLQGFDPSVAAYFEFKDYLLGINNPVGQELWAETGFKKVAAHQMSYSGLGTKAGGPIGGVSQAGKYTVGCRYTKSSLRRGVDRISSILSTRVSPHYEICTCVDFQHLIADSTSRPAVLYLDPPYYTKGPELYQFSFGEDDHERLASALKHSKYPWLLSYDDHPAILAKYEGWADIERLDFVYTINAHQGGIKKREVLISSKSFESSL